MLTGIGLGTAFAMLGLLMTAITLLHRISGRLPGEATNATAPQSAAAEAASRDRALAAAIAVSALLADTGRAQTPGGGYG